jgi:membrane fusion protein (multidrug efflux system)
MPELPKKQAPNVLTTLSTSETIPIFGEWVGTTQGFVNAEIRPKVQGYLREQAYRNGDVVKKGELLFLIDPRQFQAQLEDAQGSVGQARAALERSRQDVTRYRPLAARGAVSQKELDDAILSAEANEAALESANAALDRAKLDVEWTRIESPIEGVSGIAISQIGDLVGETTILTTVSTVNPIKVEFPISEQQYMRFRRAQLEDKKEGEGVAQLILADGTVYGERGSFYAMGREINAATGTIQVEATFPNPQRLLRPGQYGVVRAQIDLLVDATTIPQRAIQDVQGVQQVAIVGADDVIEIRNVTTGPTHGTRWVIDKGLKPGVRIVVEGLQNVRQGMKVKAKPAPTPTASGPSVTTSPKAGN